jgi:hypothetical protein
MPGSATGVLRSDRCAWLARTMASHSSSYSNVGGAFLAPSAGATMSTSCGVASRVSALQTLHLAERVSGWAHTRCWVLGGTRRSPGESLAAAGTCPAPETWWSGQWRGCVAPWMGVSASGIVHRSCTPLRLRVKARSRFLRAKSSKFIPRLSPMDRMDPWLHPTPVSWPLRGALSCQGGHGAYLTTAANLQCRWAENQ